MCTYIGGISRNLDISEVVNNNLAAEDGTAVIAGKGVGAGDGSFTYTTDEHCVVMCIYHAVPLLDYTITGQDGQLLVTDAESLLIPEFDNIGMEVLPMTQIFNSPKASIVNLFNAGYNPRYFNWKTKLDVVNGAFTTTLKSWVSPVSISIILYLADITVSLSFCCTSTSIGINISLCFFSKGLISFNTIFSDIALYCPPTDISFSNAELSAITL